MDSPAWHASSALASHIAALRAARAAAVVHARPTPNSAPEAEDELVSSTIVHPARHLRSCS